jgi:F0F1-type ATP synthase assembly protein I
MRDDTPRPNLDKPEKNKDELNIGSFAGVGLQFAVAIILFLFAGRWADQKFGTSPIFLLAGVFIGGGGAFFSMYRRLTAAQKADDERRKRERMSKP